jgi:two-component sensor histidine kinase
MVTAVYMMTLFNVFIIIKCLGVIFLTALLSSLFDKKLLKYGTVMGMLFMMIVFLSDILTLGFLRFYLGLNKYNFPNIGLLSILVSKVLLLSIIVFSKRLLEKTIRKINFGNAVIIILPNFFNLNLMLLIGYRMYNSINIIDAEVIFMILAALMLVISTLCNITTSDYYFETKEIEHNSKMNMAQLQMQYEYYKNRQEEQMKVRELYHDMKNHLHVLQNQLEAAQKEKYISNMLLEIKGFENYIETGNEFLDCIINEKQKTALTKEIDFLAEIEFTEADFMKPMDICTIFSNAIDNAIEACEKLSDPEKKLITVKAKKIRSFLSITFENSNLSEIIIENQMIKTSKPDKRMHGFGLNNIRKTIEKYQGDYKIKTEKGRFILYLVIPVLPKIDKANSI